MLPFSINSIKKAVKLFTVLFFCLSAATIFSSCKKGVNLEKIAAMEEGVAKDSAMLYYYQGLKAGDLVRMMYYSDPEKNAMNDTVAPQYLTTSPKDIVKARTDKNYKEQKKVCRVFYGDTLQILGGYSRICYEKNIIQRDKYDEYVKVRAIKNGRTAGEGWFFAGFLKPLKHNWAVVFYAAGDDVVPMMIVYSLIILAAFGLWKLIHWLIVDKMCDDECFWKDEELLFKKVYLIMSGLVGLMIFYVHFNDELVNSLKFNPDFFVHFSEYPFLLKLLPLVVLLWLASAIAMLWEMITEFRTGWVIVYFPGILSIGFLVIALTFIASWLIYAIIPVIIYLLFTGESSGSGSSSSSKEGGVPWGYNESGQPIRKGSGGHRAYRTREEYIRSKKGRI